MTREWRRAQVEDTAGSECYSHKPTRRRISVMAASSVRVLHTAGDETDYSGTALLSLALLSP